MSSGPGRREVAHRVFAAEFDDADFSYSESDEERAPNYVVTPSGARVNRLFFVGVLTEKEQVNEDMLRARVVDPTGAFVTYAGQYQPDELAFLERADPPAFLAVTGKARTFQPEDSDRIYTSVRPESISQVDAETRDRWVVQAAARTHERVRVMASAIESGLEGEQLETALRAAGIEGSLAEGVALALDHYGTTPAYLAELHDTAVEAARMVAGEVDEARRPTLAPDEGDGDASTLADPDLVDELASAAAAAPEPGAPAPEPEPAAEETAAEESTVEPTAEAGAEAEAGSEATPEPAETAEEATADPGAEPATEAAEAEEPVVGAEDVPATEDERAVEAAEPEPESTVEAEEPVAEPGSEPAVEGVETEEPEVEPADVPSTETESAGEAAEELGEFEPGELDVEEEPEEALTEEERQQVEEEFGTDFSTGKEVESEPELGVEEEPSEAEPEVEAEAETAAEAEAEPEVEEAAGEVDLETAVMDAMRDLDEGEGADRDAVITAVVEEHGVAADEVESAIQDALMSGQCYEPADGKLKPI